MQRALLLLCAVLAGCGRAPSTPVAAVVAPPQVAQEEPAAAAIRAAIAAAVAHADRSAEDRARDANRLPAEVLAFYAVQPGQRVLELAGGAGYFTTLVARVVGAGGHVLVTRLRDPELAARLGNVTLIDDLAAVPAGSIDFVFTAQNYHDFVNIGIDRQVMVAAWRRALKPGGRIGVIDHSAPPGSGNHSVGTAHRIDEAFVVAELEGAGLRVTRRSDLLRRAADARTLRVTDPAIRGRTDQFILELEVAPVVAVPVPAAAPAATPSAVETKVPTPR